MNLFWQNQSWALARANQLLKWVDSGAYQAVLDRVRTEPVCPACGKALKGNEVFCPGCGARLQAKG